MRTLIAFLHGLGDNLMFTPVLRAYANSHPGEEIHMAVMNADAVELWRGHPLVKSVQLFSYQPHFWNPLLWPVHRRRTLNCLSQLGFDKVLLPQAQTTDWWYRLGIGRYEPHKTLQMAKELGVTIGEMKAELYIPEECCALPEGPFVIVHPFAGHALKAFRPETLERVRAEAQCRLVIVGRPSDQLGPEFGPTKTMAVRIGQLIYFLKRAKACYATDSFVAHLAGAVGIPVTIFTPKWRPERYRPLSPAPVKIIPI